MGGRAAGGGRGAEGPGRSSSEAPSCKRSAVSGPDTPIIPTTSLLLRKWHPPGPTPAATAAATAAGVAAADGDAAAIAAAAAAIAAVSDALRCGGPAAAAPPASPIPRPMPEACEALVPGYWLAPSTLSRSLSRSTTYIHTHIHP